MFFWKFHWPTSPSFNFQQDETMLAAKNVKLIIHKQSKLDAKTTIKYIATLIYLLVRVFISNNKEHIY